MNFVKKYKTSYNADSDLMVMSIMTYYAKKIFNGSKIYEFRKSPIPQSHINKQIFVYSAKGDKAIIGSFKVKQIFHGSVSEIMRITGYDKREDGYEIIQYYGENSNCYALELYDVKKFSKVITLKELRRIEPNIRLPQYYSYIKANSQLYKRIKELN